MASRLAHEFNQVLAVIGSQTGVIVSRLKPDDPLHGPVDEIFRSGERAATLTAQLLALRLDETTIRDTLSLSPAIVSMRATLQALLPGSIDVRVPDESTPVLGEIGHERLEYLLLHLVANARDAMPTAGRVDIALDIVTGELLPAEQLEKNPSWRRRRVRRFASWSKSFGCRLT